MALTPAVAIAAIATALENFNHEIRDLKREINNPRYSWNCHRRPFVIPEKVSRTHHTPKPLSSQISAPHHANLTLPSYHVDSLDQICLALTCKRLLQISASVSVKTPSPTRSLSPCPKMKLLRRLMPLDARGRPKRTWAVCGDCLRYRPTRKSYWKAKQSVRVKTKAWEGVVKSWNVKYSLQCPECWFDERRSQVFSTYFK